MNVKVEDLGKNMAKITVEVPYEVFDKATVAAYNKRKGSMSIPGFRKGKAPKAMLEKAYGPTVFYEDAIDTVLNDTYPQAADESKLDIVSRPGISIEKIEKGQPFVYTAEVAVKPAVTLGEYKGIEVPKADTTVTAEDVEKELKLVQNRNARVISVDDPAKEIADGDIAVIDFEGFKDGVPFEGGKGENFELTIGSHQFIDTFEPQLIGHKIGDDFEINVTFPEKYQSAELAGQPAMFKVKVNGIKVKEIPALDDEFASEVSEFETLDEYKADLEKKLKSDKEKAAAQANEENVIKAVVEAASMEVPEAMIDTRLDSMVEDYSRRLQAQGVSLEQYFQFTGTDMNTLKEQMKPQAEARIKSSLVLEAIVAAEHIEVSDERYEQELENMAKNYKLEVENLKKMVSEDDEKRIRQDLACQEALDFVVAEAKLVDAKAE